MSDSLTQIDRIRDFLIYTFIEQEKKLFEKTLQTQSVITNAIALWYSYSSAFAATTLSMRIPLWFVYSIWTVWNPELKLADLGRINPSPDAQGASLALLASLDLPEHVTPARHLVALSKWARELLTQWNKDRATVLTRFSLQSAWAEVEDALLVFYQGKVNAAVDADGAFLERMWSLCDRSLTAGMPQEMTPDDIKVHVLGSPLKPAK